MQPADPTTHLLGVVLSGQWWVITLLDLLTQGEEVHLVAVEGALEGGHLRGRAHRAQPVALGAVPKGCILGA